MFTETLRYLLLRNILRGQVYPLCVGAGRGVQAAVVAETARAVGARAVAHGCTAAGNDQVRFDVALRTLAPELEILAPVRDEGLTREEEAAYLARRGVPVSAQRAAYSVNYGLWACTIGGRETTDTVEPLPEEAWVLTRGAFDSPRAPERHTIGFEAGVPTAWDWQLQEAVALIESVNGLAGSFGIARGIHLKDTALGVKGRVGFEAPAAVTLITAHRELEKLTLTGRQQRLKGCRGPCVRGPGARGAAWGPGWPGHRGPAALLPAAGDGGGAAGSGNFGGGEVVVAARVLGVKSTYDQLELPSGRLSLLQAGDVVAKALGHRNALFGYSGKLPAAVQPGDRLNTLNTGGVVRGERLRLRRHRLLRVGADSESGNPPPGAAQQPLCLLPPAHRHTPEMVSLLAAAGPAPRLEFVPHSGPLVRGIHATIRVPLPRPGPAEEVAEILAEFYRGSPLVEVTLAPPRLAEVVGTNRCRLGVAVHGETAVLLSALNNLGKGAAGGRCSGSTAWRGCLKIPACAWPDWAGTEMAAASDLLPTHPLLPVAPVRGHGAHLLDDESRDWLDFYAGHALASLGYGHSRLLEALRRQAEELFFQSNVVPVPVREGAARRLLEFCSPRLAGVLFVNSGAEANEDALRLAFRATGRRRPCLPGPGRPERWGAGPSAGAGAPAGAAPARRAARGQGGGACVHEPLPAHPGLHAGGGGAAGGFELRHHPGAVLLGAGGGWVLPPPGWGTVCWPGWGRGRCYASIPTPTPCPPDPAGPATPSPRRWRRGGCTTWVATTPRPRWRLWWGPWLACCRRWRSWV